MKQVIPHWLTKQANISPNKIAVELENGESFTFAQLCEKSKSFAKKLASTGVKKHHHIAILFTNSIEMIIAIHALSFLSAVGVMLNTRLTKIELADQIKRANVSLVITTEALITEKSLHFDNQVTFANIQKQNEANVDLATEIDLDLPFTMMFTSGTTGLPKAVVHTYGNHWWSAIGSLLNLGHDEDDKWLLPLPIFHVGGLSILIRSVIYGMPIIVMEKYERHKLYKLLVQRKITIVSLVTLMFQQLLDDLGERKLPVSVRCILLGGGTVPKGLLDHVKNKDIPLFHSYGMTETSSQIVTLSNQYTLKKLGSAGKPLFPAQIKINRLKGEAVGEILVKGPMVFHGYYKNDMANKESFIDGWFKTGDLGYLDDDGFLYVVERRSDLIISGGENIYPSEIEHILLEIDGVEEAAVVGVPNKKWGKVPVAYIVKQQKELSEIEILDHLETKLARFKIPRKIIFISSLPRNAANKIMRHKLLAENI